MVLPHQGRQRKKTLKTLPADLIHMIAGELYKVGTPLDLYNLYRLVASPATAAPTVGTPLVESWLYRKVDLDFAGAESVGTTRLLKSLFDEKLDVRKYVRQLTVTIGPTAMRQGGAGFRQRRIALGRYLQYVLKMIPLLPNLKTFRWNTLLPMSFRIFHAVREHTPIQNLHVTLLMDPGEGFEVVQLFQEAGFNKLTLTLYHSSPTILRLLELEETETFSWSQYGRLVYPHGDRAVAADQTKFEDMLISMFPRNTNCPDKAERGYQAYLSKMLNGTNEHECDKTNKEWDEYESEVSESNTKNIIEELYLDGYRFGDRIPFEELRECIDFGKLNLLEVRHCHDIMALLKYMLDELVGGINLKTIRIVGVQPLSDRSHVEQTFDLYSRFFRTYKGFEEIVIDDHTFNPFLIREIGPSQTLKRLELHFPRQRIPEQLPMKEPLVFDPIIAAGRDALAIEEICRWCENLTELNIDLRLEQTTDKEFLMAFRSQKRIQSLSLSFQSDETLDMATAEKLARDINSGHLRQLEIHYRPVFYPYITRWDRFGPDEPWPVRTSEELGAMASEIDPMCGLQWIVEYERERCEGKDAWLWTGTPQEKALRRACRATSIRYKKPSKERHESSGLRWCMELYQAAQDLTIDIGEIVSDVPRS
ncbi:MAG: hypothetical protein LQ346_005290 [Caloplaca aetnensis]|nr:MAG: hypothetical protein LQ346_005290 [Caloplaca aetnensis]